MGRMPHVEKGWSPYDRGMSQSTEATEQLRVLGEAFIQAIAARDFGGMLAAVADDVRFRTLLPGGPEAQVGATEVVGSFVDWYASAEEMRLESSKVESVGDRLAMSYRFRLHDAGGWRVVNQYLVADVASDGRLQAIDLLCSGFLPDPQPEADGTYRFDAGNLGCADGLAGEFRRRIAAIPLGDVLVVTARDPAAKEDLPPLARMMGHEVRSTETFDDGRLLIAVERGR